MRTWPGIVAALVWSLLVLLGACGQKGPLYHSEQGAAPASPPSTVAPQPAAPEEDE